MALRIGVVLPYRARDDLITFVESTLDLAADLEIVGAQDGLRDDDLRELGRDVPPGAYAEILADGSTVFLTHQCVAGNFAKQARRLLDEGCDAVMVCCTMDYPELDAMRRVVTPYTVLQHVALAMLTRGGTLGVMQPLETAKDFELERWRAFCESNDLELVSVVAAPDVPGAEEGSEDEMAASARSLANSGADVIVLDCMAYTDKHHALVAAAAGRPVLRPMSLTASLISEAFALNAAGIGPIDAN